MRPIDRDRGESRLRMKLVKRLKAERDYARYARRAFSWMVIVGFGFLFTGIVRGQSKPTEMGPPGTQLVIIDTDIGDDVDDAYAVGLALQSPELKILGITTAWGNTTLRARLVLRLLEETGRQEIPVAVGIEKYPEKGKLTFSQERY